MKSVKFWRENPANEHSISSEKFRIQKIREIRSSQFIVPVLVIYAMDFLRYISVSVLKTYSFITSVSQFLKERG
jgi:hypothetical protein